MNAVSWTGRPEAFHITCPKCGGRATFEEPFIFYSKDDPELRDETRPVHQWGGWFVAEKYPNVIPWVAPRGSHQGLAFPTAGAAGSGYYIMHKSGVVRCGACHYVGVHELKWPDDAFYRWDIRGDTLWAWSAEHARVLLEFIGSEGRDPAKFPGYRSSLRKLPKKFLSAKVRDVVVKRISSTLNDAG